MRLSRVRNAAADLPGLPLEAGMSLPHGLPPYVNQDRFPRVCQVGNGIETLTRSLLRNRLHRIQICAALGRIARGVNNAASAAQARGGSLTQFGFRLIVRSDKQVSPRAMPQRKAICLLQSANEMESRNQFRKIQFGS
jgi:hypothetical protein